MNRAGRAYCYRAAIRQAFAVYYLSLRSACHTPSYMTSQACRSYCWRAWSVLQQEIKEASALLDELPVVTA